MTGCPSPLGRVCYAVWCPVHRGRPWELIEARVVSVECLVWPDHDLDPRHTAPGPHPRDDEPIYVEALRGDPGRYFVHDGRSRAIRARAHGHEYILARVID